MRRSGWVTGVVVAQVLGGAILVGTCIVLLVVFHGSELTQGPDPAAAVQGLKLAIAILGPMTLVVFVGAWGLVKIRLWGWWLALLTDVGLFGVFLYSMVDDGLNQIDWDRFAFTAIAFVLVALGLIPAYGVVIGRMRRRAAQLELRSREC